MCSFFIGTLGQKKTHTLQEYLSKYANQAGITRLTAVDEWLILSKRNFKFDLGDVLLLPSAEDGSKEKLIRGQKSVISKMSFCQNVDSRILILSVCLHVNLLGLPVGLRHMMTGVPDPWLSMLMAGLKAEEDAEDGWLA